MTYLTNGFVLSANDSSHIVADTIIADVLTLQEVLGHYLSDLINCGGAEAILLHVELDDSVIGQQGSLESRSVALVDLIARDVKLLDRLVVANVLREGFTEHVTQQVSCQVKSLKLGLLHSQVNAHFLSGLVVNTV